MELTYTSYLKIDDLLNMQVLQSKPEEHDEMLFIMIHQAYELWFKQILHEADYLVSSLRSSNIQKASKTLKRINTILKVLVHQVDILETMTPTEFLSFRNYLQSASGFQSWQFRELEFLLGNKRLNILNSFTTDSKVYSRLEKRYNYPSLWDIFLRYLSAQSYQIPSKFLERNFKEPYESNEEVQAVLIEIYKNNTEITQFCELMIDLDEGLQEWRYRHVKMVERTIGSKSGTGGSMGAAYLQSTLFKPVFPELWMIRTRLENV